MIVKTNAFGIDGCRLVLGFFFFSFQACSGCFLQRPPTFVLEILLSVVKTSLIANMGFFKTLSRSIYTSFMIKGGGQDVLKRKNY